MTATPFCSFGVIIGVAGMALGAISLVLAMVLAQMQAILTQPFLFLAIYLWIDFIGRTTTPTVWPTVDWFNNVDSMLNHHLAELVLIANRFALLLVAIGVSFNSRNDSELAFNATQQLWIDVIGRTLTSPNDLLAWEAISASSTNLATLPTWVYLSLTAHESWFMASGDSFYFWSDVIGRTTTPTIELIYSSVIAMFLAHTPAILTQLFLFRLLDTAIVSLLLAGPTRDWINTVDSMLNHHLAVLTVSSLRLCLRPTVAFIANDDRFNLIYC